MLELPIVNYRVAYEFSTEVTIEIARVGLDWAWVVRRNGEVLRAENASSESSAEREAVNFAKGC